LHNSPFFKLIRSLEESGRLGTALALTEGVRRSKAVLRISVTDESEKTIQLRVEGWLVGAWVDELRLQTQTAFSQAKTLSLDLEKLWFVDAHGAALLRDLARRNVVQLNCSPFIDQQLNETAL
jgi:ABC-type transporter Mla MlaB component